MEQNKQLRISYTNYRQETRERIILPKEIWYGSTQWHPEEQWLLKAVDVEKGEDRDFAMKDIHAMQPVAVPPQSPTSQPAQKVDHVKLYADGGSRGNPGPSASGYVIIDNKTGQVLFEAGVYLGITTNNQAEYQALKFGLEHARKIGAREVYAHMDSMLVINQMKGIFKVKNRDLWPIHEAIKELCQSFDKVTFTHVPRELNKLADAEVNKCLDAQA